MSIYGYSGSFDGMDSKNGLHGWAIAYDSASAGTSRSLRSPFPATSWAPFSAITDDLLVAVDGDPDFARIQLTEEVVKGPAERILTLYRDRGLDVLKQLRGSFSLAIADRRNRRVVLAVDPMGIGRMTFRSTPAGIVFSSSAEAVARFPAFRASVRRQAIFDYLLLHMVPAPHTIFDGVSKLQAGTCAIFEGGRLSIQRIWSPNFESPPDADFSDLKAELHSSLRRAVSNCNPDSATGAFLSGGLDSSTVCGMLGAVTGRQPASFSIGFGVAEFNEIEYARIAGRRFSAVMHEYDVTPSDIVSAFPLIADAYDEPFGNSSAVPTYFCAKLARSAGVTHLLAGDGGDELFSGNERYAKQRPFERYQHLPRALRSGLLEPLIDRIAATSSIMPLRKARSYVEQARIPLPERLEYWNYMYQADADAMLDPDFRASVDPKAALADMVDIYSQAPTTDVVQRMLYFDWQRTLADNDLRKVGTMCELAGVRVSYPMLHADVVDLSARVPPDMMMPGTKLRHFFKEAMRGFLPDEIITKHKHGFGLPFGTWLKTHPPLAELIYAHLSDLKRRRILRPEFLDRLIDEHRSGHPSYFGYAIWDLAMLEAWCASHVGP